MKRIGNLYEVVIKRETILLAHEKASKGKRHYESVRYVDENIDKCVSEIQRMLIDDTYIISSEDYRIKTFIDKGKERTLHVLPYFPHRIIQWAIILAMQDSLNNLYYDKSYASIKGKGTLKASKDLRKALRLHGDTHYLQIDVAKFYPNVDRDIMMSIIRRKYKDSRLAALLSKIVYSAPGRLGLALGSLLSQWLGNLYLTYFDYFVKHVLKVKSYFRYCDDVVILGSSRIQINVLRVRIKAYLIANLRLLIKPSYRIARISDGIDFVGYKHTHGTTRLRRRIKYSLRSLSHTAISHYKRAGYVKSRHIRALSSYIGWVVHGDCRGLKVVYIVRLLRLLKGGDTKCITKTSKYQAIPSLCA